MVWIQWILQHPGEVFQVIKLGFQIAHKLSLKRRARRQKAKKVEEEEKRFALYRYNGKPDLK